MKENKNMELYLKFKEVPDEAKKTANVGGRVITDINPMWRIKTLTEVFGPVGFGWRYHIDRQWTETYGDHVRAFCNVSLYVKHEGQWSDAIEGTGGNWFARKKVDKYDKKMVDDVSDECYKMALTDALSIACKALGIGADVWYDADKTKYTQEESKKEDEAKPVDKWAGIKYGEQQTKLIRMYTGKFKNDPMWPVIEQVLHIRSREEFRTLYRTYSFEAENNTNLYSTFNQISHIYPKIN